MTEVRLKDIVKINSRALSEGADPNLCFRYIDIGSVNELGGIDLPDQFTYFTSAPSRARRIAPAGSTVISTVRTYLRAVARVPETADQLIFSTGFAVLEAEPSVDSRFLSYYCRSEPFIHEVVSRSAGVSYPAINATELGGFRLDLPSLEEQRRIADFLDAVTSAIDAVCSRRKAQQQLINERRERLVTLIFDESQSGKEISLKRLLRSRPRYGVLVPEFVDEGAPFVRINDLSELDKGTSGLPRIPHALSLQYKRTIVTSGDLLVSVVGTLGKVALADSSLEGANVNRPISVLRTHSEVDPNLLRHWIMSHAFAKQALDATASDSAQRTLGMEDLSNFSIRWPTNSNERTEITRQLDAAEQGSIHLLDSIDRQHELLAERRQALITAAVTGQLDVTTARSGWGERWRS